MVSKVTSRTCIVVAAVVCMLAAASCNTALAVEPGVSISNPSAAFTKSGPVSFTVTYTNAASISLGAVDVVLNKTGTADGSVAVSTTGASTRAITISMISGDGTLGISILSGSALSGEGIPAPAAGPSATFIADNTPPADFEPVVVPSGWTNAASVSSSFSTTDNLSGVSHYLVKLDGAPYAIHTSPFVVSTDGLADGMHTVHHLAIDYALNSPITMATSTWTRPRPRPPAPRPPRRPPAPVRLL